MKLITLFVVGLLILTAACSAPPPTTAPAATQPTQVPAATLAPAPTQAPEATTAPAQAPSVAPTTSSTTGNGAQTYTVLVGNEDTTNGVELDAFFPSTVHVHVGDTIVWKENVHEIHTVSFLGTQKVPDLQVPIPNGPQGAMMLNPQAALPIVENNGQYDGTGIASSGILGPDQGQAQSFTLTFTKAGTYQYVCIVHAEMKMLGTVVVADASTDIPSPSENEAQAKKEIDSMAAQVPDILKAAAADQKPDTANSDGTTTHYVIMGYTQGQIDVTAFFPKTVNAKPGDSVVYMLGPHNVAPHTATFLNGVAEPGLVSPIPQPNGPPLLAFNPAVALPQNVNQPLTNQGLYNSGLLAPGSPATQFTFKVGSTPGALGFICVLHNDNGMTGTLNVSQ